jgi:hypothetical protein
MTKRLEEVFDLAPMQEDEPETEPTTNVESEVMNAITVTEKIEHALATVGDLHMHDKEMDEIFDAAFETYEECKELALSSHDAHAAKMMEAAATMLKTAMEARDSKTNRKIKMVELQLKKAKLDLDVKRSHPAGVADPTSSGAEFDRNELLKHIRER